MQQTAHIIRTTRSLVAGGIRAAIEPKRLCHLARRQSLVAALKNLSIRSLELGARLSFPLQRTYSTPIYKN